MTDASSVLVTGARGFVGRAVVARLRALGLDPIRIDHAWATVRELDALVGERPVDRAIHAGWYADPADYLTAPRPNLRSLQASLELVDVLGDRGCRSLVVVGSCAEYRPSAQPHRETDPVEPWSVYGAAKASLRLLLESSLRPASMGLTWARLFNLTGPGEHPQRLVPAVFNAVASGRSIDLSPGEQVRDFLDVEDVAGALLHLSMNDPMGAVNVCSGIGITLRYLLEEVADRAGDRSLLRFGARDYGAHDSMVTIGDPARLDGTGWAPAHSTTDMIDRVAAFWGNADNQKAPLA